MTATVTVAFSIDYDNAEVTNWTNWTVTGQRGLRTSTKTPILIGEKAIGYVNEDTYDDGRSEYEYGIVNAVFGNGRKADGFLAAAMACYTDYIAKVEEDRQWEENSRRYNEHLRNR